MALDARHRSSIYTKLVPVLGDDDANALMSEFPTIEADELVTEQFLRAEISGLRGEMHTEFANVRDEMHTEFANVRDEIIGLRGELHTEIGKVSTTLERRINLQTVWLGGLLVSVVGLLRLMG